MCYMHTVLVASARGKVACMQLGSFVSIPYNYSYARVFENYISLRTYILPGGLGWVSGYLHV